MRGMGARWEHFAHGADVGVRGRGASKAEAFAQAALAMTAVVADPAGVEPRESVATASTPDSVSPGQAYAWNPSITGVKSEDTILVGEQNNEIITEMDGWPTINVQIDNQTIKRPAILEREPS